MQKAYVIWRAGNVPVSAQFGDPYFADTDGLAETQHVFLEGNGLPARFRSGFHVAELGFGTGLNALAAWEAWDTAGIDGDLRFTSFEAYPLDGAAMARALAAWPALGARAEALVAAWSAGVRDIRLPGLHLRIVEGDARETLPAWDGVADAWFLDGFAPARNPEMWEDGLIGAVARRTAPGGSFATYSAAGTVRARLAAAGFAVTRCTGFGRKRHMTRGVLKP